MNSFWKPDVADATLEFTPIRIKIVTGIAPEPIPLNYRYKCYTHSSHEST